MSRKSFSATGVRRIWNATGYSFQGIKAAWGSEAAVRQELILAVFLLPTALWLAQSLAQLIGMLMSLFMVIIIELLNTAIEYTVDRVGTERHELSGKAKDIASAAVFFGLVQFLCVWGVVILNRLGWLSY
ncbi:MAG: diacylglycerol kinase [Oceanospirillaceae bacterium]|nr:diacylglycerol kinase [Oceanospirillaceae bacterium]MCP5350647.1 diacylglycerol kinase [Oceanospirillaceae bacterium]